MIYIIIIILVARLLLKLGLGEPSLLPAAQGLCKNDCRLTFSHCPPWVDIVLSLFMFPPASLARLGIGSISIVLPRYSGPINRSLTDLLRRSVSGRVAGSGANLSGLSEPSLFFSPARIALSRFRALMCWALRKWTTKKMTIPTRMITATAIPIPMPALAPADVVLFCRCIVGSARDDDGSAESNRPRVSGR